MYYFMPKCQTFFFFFFKLLPTKPFCHLMFSLLNKLFKDKTILLPNVLFHFTLLNYIWRWKISLPKPFFFKKKIGYIWQQNISSPKPNSFIYFLVLLYLVTKYFIAKTFFFFFLILSYLVTKYFVAKTNFFNLLLVSKYFITKCYYSTISDKNFVNIFIILSLILYFHL